MKRLLFTALLLCLGLGTLAQPYRYFNLDNIYVGTTPAKLDSGYLRGNFGPQPITIKATRLALLPVATILFDCYTQDPGPAPASHLYDRVLDVLTAPAFPAAASTSFTTSRPLDLTPPYPGARLVLITSVTVYYADGSLGADAYITPYISSAVRSPLPVTLVKFGGSVVHDYDVLRWTTASEVNAHHFEVETSLTGGNDFLARGSVTATGGAGGASYSYQYPAQSQSWYVRLKTVDTNGTVSYSPVIYLPAGGAAGEQLLVVGSRGYAFPLAAGDAAAQYMWRDLAGRTVLRQPAGELALGLASGMYLVTMQTQQGQVATRKVLVD